MKKRACPYCEKKLQAKTQHAWHVNLARHLARTCKPYQREQLSLMTRALCKLIDAFLPIQPDVGNVEGYVKALTTNREVTELERLAKL